MPKSIMVHSFKGGTGKSTLTANLAVALAQRDLKVGVVDMDLAGPGIHVIFGIRDEDARYTMNDVFLGRAEPAQTAVDLTQRLGLKRGRLVFTPASTKVEDMLAILRSGLELVIFKEAIGSVAKEYALDYVMIDSHPGVEDDTLLSLGVCDLVLVVSRIDQQDIFGTGVIMKLAATLEKKALMILNQIPKSISHRDLDDIGRKVGDIFQTKVVATVPFYDDILETLSKQIFTLTIPKHEFSLRINSVVDQILDLQKSG